VALAAEAGELVGDVLFNGVEISDISELHDLSIFI
jgi:hypothetical protein